MTHLPLDAREWEGAWPVYSADADDEDADESAALAVTGAQTPLRAIAGNMRETIEHVRAFPDLAQALSEEVRAVQCLVGCVQLGPRRLKARGFIAL